MHVFSGVLFFANASLGTVFVSILSSNYSHIVRAGYGFVHTNPTVKRCPAAKRGKTLKTLVSVSIIFFIYDTKSHR